MKEIFKDIVGYEGRYQVSNKGRVISLPNKIYKKVQELKYDVSKRKHTSYRRVTFSLNGKIKRFQVHQLVAAAFIPNPDNKPHVNHIDNNGLNNKVTNLEWTTYKENMAHSAKQGRQDNVRHLGGVATGKIQEERKLKELSALLGSRLISTEVIKKRRYVVFTCKHCQNSFRRRSDSPWVVRGGICRDCYKDEDMVWAA